MRSNKQVIVIRGGGDIATGVVQKFYRAGYRVLILETEAPTAIRRSVALSEAVYDGIVRVEDMVCRKVSVIDELSYCWQIGDIPLIVDPSGRCIEYIKPTAVIDAIIAKKNLGTTKKMAGITIALGPGFKAGKDVHAVIETLRGHDLGRLILVGFAKPDTGVPGEIAGESIRRVLHAPATGVIKHNKQIGDIVKQGDMLFLLVDKISKNGKSDTEPNEDSDLCETVIGVKAPINGLLRGLIREGMQVHDGMKVADIDTRTNIDWHTISDKARCIGGATLEAFLYLQKKH